MNNSQNRNAVEREWIWDCIFYYAGPGEESQQNGTNKWRLKIGDVVLHADGDVFLGNVAFDRSDAINVEFGGFHVLRDAGSSEIRLIDSLGCETRLKYHAFRFCGMVWTSRWFRLIPRGTPTVIDAHEIRVERTSLGGN